MKRISILLVALLCSISFYGQGWDNAKPDKRLTFGVRAGANNSTLMINDDRYVGNSKWGLYGGVNVDYNIVKSFAVETGLFFSEKGCRFSYGDHDDLMLKISFLQIPLFALYRLPFSENLNLQVKAGGYAGIAVDKYKDKGNYNKEGFSRDVDAGTAFGVGLSYKKIYFGVQYELGLTILDFYMENINRNLTISVGYDF